MNAFAKLVQFIGHASFIIAEVMKMNTNAKFLQHHDPVHHINGAAVICGPWHIKTNDM
jgi:hypothetical protein